MTHLCTFFAAGVPVPQPRPRVSTRGGFARAYVPSKHAVHEWRQAVTEAFHGPVVGPYTARACGVDIAVFLPRPKSHFRTGRFGHLVKDAAPRHPCARGTGDGDNYAKAVLDALEGQAFGDDSQVCDLTVRKRYATEESPPGVRVSIYTIDP